MFIRALLAKQNSQSHLHIRNTKPGIHHRHTEKEGGLFANSLMLASKRHTHTHTNTHAYSHSYSSEWRVKKTFSFTHSLRRHTNFSPSHQSFYFLSIHTYIRRYTRTHSSIELKAKMQFWQIHDGREGKSAWAWSSCYVTCGWCHLFRSGFLFLCIN